MYPRYAQLCRTISDSEVRKQTEPNTPLPAPVPIHSMTKLPDSGEWDYKDALVPFDGSHRALYPRGEDYKA